MAQWCHSLFCIYSQQNWIHWLFPANELKKSLQSAIFSFNWHLLADFCCCHVRRRETACCSPWMSLNYHPSCVIAERHKRMCNKDISAMQRVCEYLQRSLWINELRWAIEYVRGIQCVKHFLIFFLYCSERQWEQQIFVVGSEASPHPKNSSNWQNMWE